MIQALVSSSSRLQQQTYQTLDNMNGPDMKASALSLFSVSLDGCNQRQRTYDAPHVCFTHQPCVCKAHVEQTNGQYLYLPVDGVPLCGL